MPSAVNQRAATTSVLAGQPAPKGILVDVAQLERSYYSRRPDLDDAAQLVSFGTSGHRGSPLRGTLMEAHILAITQAICDYRMAEGIRGPLYMGKDATRYQKTKLAKLSPAAVKESTLAGEAIIATLTRAPSNNAPIGGIKVVAANGWFAARPSGTEDIYKIYAESFRDQSHLNTIVGEAREMVDRALAVSGAAS